MRDDYRMRAIIILLAAALLGLTGGYAWSHWSKPSAAAVANAPAARSAKPGETSAELEESVYYADCAAVQKAGKAPLYPGQPGYRAELDPQNVGVACQPGAAS
jgi:hypothetical protein